MQTLRTFILLMALVTLSSCQFNQSVNKDVTTGAYSRGDGIGVDDITIEVNGETDNRNEFMFGEHVNLLFDNVSGLTKANGKTFPELAMYIVKNEKDTMLAYPNLLKSLNAGTELSPLQLQATFSAALPNKNNEKYKVFIEITDKKGKGKFNYELPFTVKPNDLLNLKSNGIEYSNIYLWNDTLKQPVFDNNISFEHLFILILDDIEGLEITNEKVFPIFSVDLVDSSGHVILSSPNILSAYEETGVNPQDLKNQITAKLTLAKGTLNNPCKLTATLKDKNSAKEINIMTELNIN